MARHLRQQCRRPAAIGLAATGPTDKITAVIGDPPKRFGVTEFENIDKAQVWLKSSGREAIAPQRERSGATVWITS
jgi:hypothetical protein